MSKPKFLDQDCALVWLQRLSLVTEYTYVQLVNRYIASLMRANVSGRCRISTSLRDTTRASWC
jgi:hypothetical protein